MNNMFIQIYIILATYKTYDMSSLPRDSIIKLCKKYFNNVKIKFINFVCFDYLSKKSTIAIL